MTTEALAAANTVESAPVESALPGGTSVEDALSDIATSMGVDDEQDSAQAGDTTEKAGEPDTGDADTTGAGQAGEAEGKGGDSNKAPDPNDRAPDTWRKEAAAEWATVPPTVKAEIAKRENDIRQYVEGIKPHIEVARGLEQVMAPLAPAFEKAGVNPWTVMPQVMQAYAIMQWGSADQKVQMFRAMAGDMGLDVQKLMENAPDPINPTVQALKQEILELKQGVRGVTSGWQQQQQAKLTAEVEAFANDQTHPHFYDVADEISRLLKSGVSKTLQDAYERAVWTNPVTRSKAISEQAKTANAEAAKKAAEKTAKAKAASAVNVSARNAGGRAAKGEETIDETLANTLAAIKAR